MREDLIQSAVSFLNDPQIADASLAKRVEFLESKKLTPEEIDEALKRAQSSPASAAESEHAPASTGASTPTAAPTGPAPSIPSYRPQYMMQPPPVPRRDWKDYFVMATVSVGVAYGIYEVTKRYVLPMILPPTPASLEADKAALEAEFERTLALVQQLHADTEELKVSEQERAVTFERVITEARETVASVQAQADTRRKDLAQLRTNVESLHELLPKALERHKETQESALRELQNELKSLKQLVGNRVRSSGPPPASSVLDDIPGRSKPFIPDPTKIPSPGPAVQAKPTGSEPAASPNGNTPPAAAETSTKGIPAWQLAAAGK